MASDQELLSAALRYWKPPERLTLSEWADQYAHLSAESSAEAGKWTTLPYQKGVMDAFTDPRIDTVVWMKSARVGATKIFNHLIGYHVHQDPCPIMLCQPTVEDAEGYSKDEIAPMIRDTPVLRGLVSDPKAKDGSNTILAKSFPGGSLGMVGANSARGFRRVSRRVVLFDEVDGYPASTTEGDQIKLGIRRSEYYWNRKIGIASTPTIKDFSRIERWFLRTDQRRYFVPCPECDHKQVLRWDQLKWDPGRPETVTYECENCAHRIPHSQKRWMVERGEWRATAQSDAPGLVGFHIWAAYSYSPNATWENLVREFLEVKGDKDQLRTFVNTVLGQTFEEDYSAQMSADGMLARREPYASGTCPDGALLLTAGVDVQGGGGSIGDRVVVSVWGWGRGEESWLIWHQEIMGDPTRREVWDQVDAVLDVGWPTAAGGELRIAQMAVDTGGHATHEAYGFVRDRVHRGVVAIKGANKRGASGGCEWPRGPGETGREALHARHRHDQGHDPWAAAQSGAGPGGDPLRLGGRSGVFRAAHGRAAARADREGLPGTGMGEACPRSQRSPRLFCLCLRGVLAGGPALQPADDVGSAGAGAIAGRRPGAG